MAPGRVTPACSSASPISTMSPSGSVSQPETAAARSTRPRITGRTREPGAAASIARAACCHSETLTSW